MKSMDAEELKKTLDVNERMVREKIQQIRTKKGLSMAEFGKLLGCERQTIFKYEKGLIKTIPLEVIIKIAQIGKLRDEDIIYQLINAKKNEELLKKVPHRIVADDLAVIYRIYKTKIDENSDEKLVTSTIILNSLMEESRYTEEKLYACASVNMPKQFPIFILNVQQSEIFSLLVNGFGYSLMDAKEKVLSMPLSNPDTNYMWAISNFDDRYGAATILYSDEIQRFANELEDDLVLVPSSTHEWFAYRKSDIEINEAYEDIIRETNETLVPKEQVLSDHLYIYERSSGTLKTFEQK